MIVLLASESLVRELTGVSDNVASKYITAALREAQDMRLRSILGSCLLDALTAMVEAGTLDDEGNERYKELAEQCRYLLVYAAVQQLIRTVSYKIANAGVVRTSDDKVANASFSEVMSEVEYYEAMADHYAITLQRWLLCNADAFAELDCDCVCRMRANLSSAASSGLWLGGARGRRDRGSGEGCCR